MKNLKFNIAVALLATFLQLILALSPFISTTANFWQVSTPQEFYSKLATALGIQFFLLTAGLSLILLRSSNDQHTFFSSMRAMFLTTTIRRLSDREFYSHFRSAVEGAKHTVKIAYLAPYPPGEVSHQERKKYYEDILQLMRKRTDLTFKRLIRRSPKNDEWTAALIGDLTGRANVDIAILNRDLPTDCEMPLALSVQVVDDTKIWLVATKTHETEGEFRDIYIENADVAAVLSGYYDRLWQLSEKLLYRGRVTPEGQALVEQVSKT